MSCLNKAKDCKQWKRDRFMLSQNAFVQNKMHACSFIHVSNLYCQFRNIWFCKSDENLEGKSNSYLPKDCFMPWNGWKVIVISLKVDHKQHHPGFELGSSNSSFATITVIPLTFNESISTSIYQSISLSLYIYIYIYIYVRVYINLCYVCYISVYFFQLLVTFKNMV